MRQPVVTVVGSPSLPYSPNRRSESTKHWLARQLTICVGVELTQENQDFIANTVCVLQHFVTPTFTKKIQLSS
jgi:hypothetical protein